TLPRERALGSAARAGRGVVVLALGLRGVPLGGRLVGRVGVDVLVGVVGPLGRARLAHGRLGSWGATAGARGGGAGPRPVPRRPRRTRRPRPGRPDAAAGAC